MIWAVSLSTTKLIPRRLTATLSLASIRSLADFGKLDKPPRPSSSSTSNKNHATLHLNAFRGEPAITVFDWPFTPIHNSSPPVFNLKWVRTSTTSYRRFILAMDRSHRFGSRTRDYDRPYSDSLSLRLPHHGLTSPRMPLTRRLILQKARHHPQQ